MGNGNDLAALLMSAIPGMGHLYKGSRSGAVVAAAGAVLVGLFVAATVSATVGLSALLLPVYWTGVMLHAYWLENRRPRVHARPFDRTGAAA